MNIFAKVIFSSNEEISKLLVKYQDLSLQDSNNDYEVYFKNDKDYNTVLINQKSQDIEKSLDFVLDNFDILNFYNIGTSLSIDTLDLKFGDVLIPNTIIDKEDNVLFLENFVDRNYDLNKFGLVLNGICLTLDKKIEDEEELYDIKNDYNCDIFDFESFKIGKKLQEKELLNKYCVIKILGDDSETFTNIIDILEFVMG